MKERHTKTLTTFSEEQNKKKLNNVLLKARKEVEINGNGTSGYVVKCGPHKGRILGHFSQKYNNNW
jgi:hypothetical protein